MSSNDLQGSLDIKDLSHLTNLKKLDLRWNRIQSLESSLHLNTSLFQETIFKFQCHFEHFPNLQGLLIDENKMVMEPSFQVHTSVSKFQLKVMTMADCITSPELHLQFLTFLYYQYDLRFVDLSENNLSGTFPNWLLQNNTKLEYLILKGNSFSGPLSLPSGSAPNWNVSLVDISDNNLQGQIPSNICATFPHLMGLFLSKNDFEGDIPPCLSGKKGLLYLDLSDNRLSGRLPEELIMKYRLCF